MAEELKTNEVVEETAKTEVVSTTAKAEEQDAENQPSLQDLLVENAKLKRKADKAANEAADWKKKYRATQSVQEIADAEKAEAEARQQEENERIRRQLNILTLEKSYLGMGFTADEAQRMAVAETDGEVESKLRILGEVESRKKNEWESEWMKSRPEISAGNGKEEEDLFVRGFKSAY